MLLAATDVRELGIHERAVHAERAEDVRDEVGLDPRRGGGPGDGKRSAPQGGRLGDVAAGEQREAPVERALAVR
eukprot:13597495-Alexandrium_andersonii.AAC.1